MAFIGRQNVLNVESLVEEGISDLLSLALVHARIAKGRLVSVVSSRAALKGSFTPFI